VSKQYGFSIGAFLRDHPGWYVASGAEGVGYQARKRDVGGRGAGPRITAKTLDELAAKLTQAASAQTTGIAGNASAGRPGIRPDVDLRPDIRWPPAR